MNKTQIEDIYNQTFSGLTLFYRDTNLTENLISKYQIGQILTEKGFTDMTYIGGGLSTNLRYLIASANAKDMSAFNPDSAKFGHVLLTADSFFKVLDIYKIKNKTQIFILEIPQNGVGLFSNANSSVEEEIIEKARNNFDTKIDTELIKELKSKEWKERTEFPLGMNSNGEFFYKETPSKVIISNEIKEEVINKNSTTENKPWWKIW